MTPNKPTIAQEARVMISAPLSKVDVAFELIARLAETITYNAEAMNKLVERVDELEKLVPHESVSETPEEGEYLEVLLKQGANKVRCVKAESNAYIVNKVYVVERRAEDGTKFVRNEQGVECGMSSSQFVVWYTTIQVCSVVQQSVPKNECAEQSFKLDFYGNTPANPLMKEQRLHMLLEQPRMFMGLPTIHLIKPRSL